jgi:hypothetical protein
VLSIHLVSEELRSRERCPEATSPVEYLVGEIQTLDKKLRTDVSRIQHDIAEYVELSQGIMQLTTIIADSVRRLPGAA